MTDEQKRKFKEKKWLAIYGAMIASQVQELRNEKSESPTVEQMQHFIEEAEAVANLEKDVCWL